MPTCYKVIIVFALLLFAVVMCLCSCSRCTTCSGKLVPGSSTVVDVCQKDEESLKQYRLRVKWYQAHGYSCD